MTLLIPSHSLLSLVEGCRDKREWSCFLFIFYADSSIINHMIRWMSFQKCVSARTNWFMAPIMPCQQLLLSFLFIRVIPINSVSGTLHLQLSFTPFRSCCAQVISGPGFQHNTSVISWKWQLKVSFSFSKYSLWLNIPFALTLSNCVGQIQEHSKEVSPFCTTSVAGFSVLAPATLAIVVL